MLKQLKQTIKQRFVLYLLLYILLNFSCLTIAVLFGPQGKYFTSHHSNKFVNALTQFDSVSYVTIAKEGYSLKNYHINAFFPLYPYIIKISSYIIKDYFIAAIISSWVFFFLAFYFLYKLIVSQYNPCVANKSILLFLTFPTSFFVFVAYSESLFLFLSITSLFFAQKDKWHLASFLAFLASMTRSVGFFLVIPLLLIYLNKQNISFSDIRHPSKIFRKLNINFICILCVPLGFLTALLIQSIYTKNLFSWFIAEKMWNRTLSLPFVSIFNAFLAILYNHAIVFKLYNLFNLAIVCLWIRTLILTRNRLPLPYFLYGIVIMLPSLCSTKLEAISRYILVNFPFFIAFSIFSERIKKPFFLAYLIGSVFMLIIFAFRHYCGGFSVF